METRDLLRTTTPEERELIDRAIEEAYLRGRISAWKEAIKVVKESK